MSRHESLRTPGILLLLFLQVAGVPFVALTWLGWQLLAQDRALEEQRFRERLESAASLVCRELDRSLATPEDLLPRVAEGIPATRATESAYVVFDGAGVVRHRGGRLPFLPSMPSQSEHAAGLFVTAERLEYLEADCVRAGAIYRELPRGAAPYLLPRVGQGEQADARHGGEPAGFCPHGGDQNHGDGRR